ncbi:MAG TPA: sigma-70 family RNA polymerase sigma factor [Gemmataceae bacterium]|nr:sigma-70 family RNA polymerase sigma factor [Gemmataceae bacterium]
MTGSPVNPDETGSSTSLGLLERVKARDPVAWQRMVSLYGPLIDRWARQAGLQEADAADVRQEVLQAVDRAIDGFRRDRPGDTFRGWLKTITRNKVLDHLRRTRGGEAAVGGSDALKQMQQLPADAIPDSTEDAEEFGQILRQALELIRTDFEERTWRAFWRVVIEEQEAAEVAAELGMSINAVYLAKGRVLARLREEFAGLMEV